MGLPLNAMILRRASRTDPRFVLGSALAFVLPLGANLAAFAQDFSPPIPPAQVPSPQVPSPSVVPAPGTPAKPDLNVLKQHDQELDAARAQQRAALEAQTKLKLEIEAIGADRRTLNQQLIDTAARVRDVEANIETTQARLKPLDEREHIFQTSLDERRTRDRRNSRRPAAHRPAAAAGAHGAAGGRAASGAHRDHARRRGAGNARAGRRAGRRSRRAVARAQGHRR